MLQRVAAFALACVTLAPVVARAEAAPLDASTVYQRARLRWAQERYPSFLDYDVAVRVTAGSVTKEERYASTFDAATGRTSISSRVGGQHAPSGADGGIRWCLQSCAPSVDAADPDEDFIGVPLLAPNYTFGLWHFIPQSAPKADDLALVQQIRAQFGDRNAATPQPRLDFPTIANVTARYHDYAMALAGIEAVNGSSCYHLRLQPRRDEARFRLRDLWVDQASYATMRARVSANFEAGDGVRMPWTIDYQTIDGRQYLASERADRSYEYGGRRYDSVELRFEHLRTRQRPPMPFAGLVANLVLTEPATP